MKVDKWGKLLSVEKWENQWEGYIYKTETILDNILTWPSASSIFLIVSNEWEFFIKSWNRCPIVLK